MGWKLANSESLYWLDVAPALFAAGCFAGPSWLSLSMGALYWLASLLGLIAIPAWINTKVRLNPSGAGLAVFTVWAAFTATLLSGYHHWIIVLALPAGVGGVRKLVLAFANKTDLYPALIWVSAPAAAWCLCSALLYEMLRGPY